MNDASRPDHPEEPEVSEALPTFDLLSEEKLLVVHGTGFNWPTHDHFRIVFLPRIEDLEDAVGRLERFLSTYSQ